MKAVIALLNESKKAKPQAASLTKNFMLIDNKDVVAQSLFIRRSPLRRNSSSSQNSSSYQQGIPCFDHDSIKQTDKLQRQSSLVQRTFQRGSGLSNASKRRSSKKSNNQILSAVGSMFCSGNTRVKNIMRTSTNVIKESTIHENSRSRKSKFFMSKAIHFH